MGFVDLGDHFKDAKEAPTAPEGTYDLVCKDYNKDEKKGYIRILILFDGHEYAPMSHFLNLPNPERDAKNDEEKGHEPGTTSRTKMLFIKRFLHLFSIPYTTNGFDDNDIPGARARAQVSQSVNEKTGRRGNDIVLPSLPEEGEASAAKGAAPQPRRRAS